MRNTEDVVRECAGLRLVQGGSGRTSVDAGDKVDPWRQVDERVGVVHKVAQLDRLDDAALWLGLRTASPRVRAVLGSGNGAAAEGTATEDAGPVPADAGPEPVYADPATPSRAHLLATQLSGPSRSPSHPAPLPSPLALSPFALYHALSDVPVRRVRARAGRASCPAPAPPPPRGRSPSAAQRRCPRPPPRPPRRRRPRPRPRRRRRPPCSPCPRPFLVLVLVLLLPPPQQRRRRRPARPSGDGARAQRARRRRRPQRTHPARASAPFFFESFFFPPKNWISSERCWFGPGYAAPLPMDSFVHVARSAYRTHGSFVYSASARPVLGKPN